MLRHSQLNLLSSDEYGRNVFHYCAGAKETRQVANQEEETVSLPDRQKCIQMLGNSCAASFARGSEGDQSTKRQPLDSASHCRQKPTEPARSTSPDVTGASRVFFEKQRNIRFSLVKAQLNVGDDRGRTALHLAVYENALTCVQAILEINVLKTSTIYGEDKCFFSGSGCKRH